MIYIYIYYIYIMYKNQSAYYNGDPRPRDNYQLIAIIL